MKIRAVLPNELSDYGKLAQTYGTLFNRLDWLEILPDNFQILGFFDSSGKLVGGASIYEERRWGLKVIRRAPFTPTCGPFVAVQAKNPVAVIEERRKALNCLIDYLEHQAPAICILPLDWRINDVLPFFWRGYKVIPNYTYVIDLTNSVEKIRTGMSPNRRNDLTKAVKDGLTVSQLTDLGIVKDFVLQTFKRQKKFVDRTTLEAILFRYSKPSNSYAFCTYQDNIPVAVCFILHDRETAYYILGGYGEEARHHGAGPLALFEAIQHAKKIGLKQFDFEGSVIKDIERYFRGFGGALTPYYTVNKAWFPLELALKSFKRNLF